MQGFRLYQSPYAGNVNTELWRIANTSRATLGGVLKRNGTTTGGLLDSAANTDDLVGIVVGFKGSDGVPIKECATADYGHTETVGDPNWSITAASDNETRGKGICVEIIPLLPGMILSGYLSAASTTTGSNLPGYYIQQVATAGSNYQLSETTVTLTVSATTLQFMTFPNPGDGGLTCLDPSAGDTRRILVRVLSAVTNLI